ncbi:MAG: hypothetical protein ACETVY_01075 [Candidatus Bathyarchaeia archaeon]
MFPVHGCLHSPRWEGVRKLFGDLHSLPKERLRTKTDELLGRVWLTEDADKQVGKYNRGMRRRINLVMGLVHDPEIATRRTYGRYGPPVPQCRMGLHQGA